MELTTLIENYLPEEREMNRIADYFDIFADRTRIKILSLLSISELCVNDICYILAFNQSTVSHQLRNLKDNSIVDCRKDGKRTIYFICNRHVENLIMQAVLASEID